MNLRVKSLSGVFALACGLLFLIAIWPACGCLPTAYREVELASLPGDVRVNAGKIEPGIRPDRAWAFWIGGRPRDRGADGYLIRGRMPGSWWDKDIKVYVGPIRSVKEPIDLQPID
jgi:hypothetical protein